MQASISAVRKEIDDLRNVTKLLPMLPHDIPISGGQCATTDQLESMLGYIQQSITNSSLDGFKQYNLTMQQLQSGLQNQVKNVQEEIANLNINVKGTHQNPANSCQQVAEFNPSSLPGYSWVANGSNSSAFVYCTPNTHCCTNASVQWWMRVANLDMIDPRQGCPTGFQLTTSPKRLCFRKTAPGCTSLTFDTHGITYSKVCGRVIGYNYRTLDAFSPYYNGQGATVDGRYVDGVSITHGRLPKQHIWTFAAAASDALNHASCPCTRTGTSRRFTGHIPPFINNEYFCEVGRTTEPLWDGEGCPSTSKCCTFNNPPWFCKQLSQTTTDDIEVRVCADEVSSREDIQIELIELYVQ